MIEIIVDNKKVNIPRYNELTVKQYKDMLKFIAESGSMDILRYISVTTGINYTKALHFKLKNVSRLNDMIGNFKFITGDIDAAKGFDYIETTKPHLIFKFGKYIYDLRRITPAPIGYRIVLEEFMKTKPTYVDMYVFMTALILNVERDNPEKAFDFSTIKEVYNDLHNYNAFKVLTIGAFFFFKWSRRENKESRPSRMLKRALLVSTRLRSLKLVLIDSRSIL